MASDFYIETKDGEKVLVGVIEGINSDGTYQVTSTFEQLVKLIEIRPDLFKFLFGDENQNDSN